MRVGIVGSNEIYSIERFYIKYFRELGVEVEIFTAPVMFREYYQRTAWNKILFRSGLSRIYPLINERLKQWATAHKPDVLWVFKGMEIFPATLQWMRDRGIKLVNYNPDNPFLFSGKGSGNSNITNSIDFYDLHLTYHPEVSETLIKRNKSKVGMLPFGFELDDVVYQRCVAEDEVAEVCFLGNPDKGRVDFISALGEKGVPVSVYGHDWNKYLSAHGNITIQAPVYGEDQWKILRKYRVQINLMRPHNLRSHNMRTFEVPGVGGIMLAPDTIDHRSFFLDGKECFLFSDLDQAVQQAKTILSFSTERAGTIRQAARDRSINSGYTYFNRAQQVLAEIKRIYA